jgi:hypothetical protein
MIVKYTLSACADCIAYVANGTSPVPGLGDIIEERLGAEDARNLVNADDSGDDEFSWQFCECCGSRLGGSRGQLAVLACEVAHV